MQTVQITNITVEELETLMEKTFYKVMEKNQFTKQTDLRFFSIHQAQKILRVGNQKIKKLIATGKLKATPDNKISEVELNKFLSNE